MALSNLTVQGVTPDLNILGNYQRFVFNNNAITKFQAFNTSIPTSQTPVQNSIELRDYAFNGFRFQQLNQSSDTFAPGTLTLQSFINDEAGTPIFTYNGTNFVFNVPVAGMGMGVGSVTGTSGQIDVANPTTTPIISIDPEYVGQTSINTLGTVTTGAWNASPVTVPFGGTGNTTLSPYSIICSGTTATGALQNVSGTGLTGQVLTSNGASTLPSWQATSASISWTDQTSATTMTPNTYYIADNTSALTLTLPASAAIGTVFGIVGKGSGGWKLAQGSSQQINFGIVETTVGNSGYISSTNPTDCVFIVCTTNNTNFTVYNAIGNLNYN